MDKWTEESAKENHIVKAMYTYYSDKSSDNYQLLINELLKYNIDERTGQINSSAIDILAVYLNFSDHTEFTKIWVKEVKEMLIEDGIL
jgi:hypothetical protein